MIKNPASANMQKSSSQGKQLFHHCSLGVTSRQEINVTTYLMPAGSGIHFIVPDINNAGQSIRIPALASHVVNTLRNVVLGEGSTRLCLVEHFLAAAAFCNVFDLDVVIDGLELPLGDGSALFWVELFTQAGFPPITPPMEYLLKEAIFVRRGERELMALPSNEFSLTYLMDWPHPRLGKRWCKWQAGQPVADIACARTFGWQNEHEMLGLTDEVVSLTQDGFSKPLHFEDEPVRHKLLDLFGDLTLSGVNPLSVQAQFISIKGGHEMDVELAKQLKDKLISKG